MSTLTELEFLLVSNDYATLTAVSGGVKKYGAKLALVPTAEAARDYLERKKMDGVFVDMQVSKTLGLIEAIRKGSSNAKVAIFACVQNAGETTATLNAGANFVMRTPLSVEGVNLSEGGMAVRAARGLKQWTVIEFALALALGVDLSGKGQVAWTSSEGMSGILFQTLHGMGRGYLEAWLAGREQLSRKPEENENPR